MAALLFGSARAQTEMPPGQCAKQPTTRCLLDFAWLLASNERDALRLQEIALAFAKMEQWERAEATWGRIPDGSSWKKSGRTHLDAEYVARDLSRGSDGRLRAASDPAVLSWAASRVFGYRERRSARLAKGFGNGRPLGAPAPMGRALLARWEKLAPPGNALHQQWLAEKWLLAGDVDRARSTLLRAQWKENQVLRGPVELLLEVNEPHQALEVIKLGQRKYQGFYQTFVARWELQRGNAVKAAEIASRAAADVIAAREFRYLPESVGLIADAGRPGAAERAAYAGELAARRPDPFRPFHLSDVGEAYGRTGRLEDCLRLQADALRARPRDNEVAGKWNLGGELASKVAAASVLCGDRTALRKLDNRVFGQQYCDLYKRNAVAASDLRADNRVGRELYTVLLDSGAECHFQLGQGQIAEALLEELFSIARRAKDFEMLRRAAELAHVFSSAERRDAIMREAAAVLLERSAGGAARQAAEFGYLWGAYGPAN